MEGWKDASTRRSSSSSSAGHSEPSEHISSSTPRRPRRPNSLPLPSPLLPCSHLHSSLAPPSLPPFCVPLLASSICLRSSSIPRPLVARSLHCSPLPSAPRHLKSPLPLSPTSPVLFVSHSLPFLSPLHPPTHAQFSYPLLLSLSPFPPPFPLVLTCSPLPPSLSSPPTPLPPTPRSPVFSASPSLRLLLQPASS